MNQHPTQTSYENIRCLLIDLDDTLYPHDSGVWDRIGLRINQFLLEEMHFPTDEVPALRKRFFRQYGTTLRGLQTEFRVNMDFYLDYVHDIPLDDLLVPDPALNQVLQALPQRKVIFTNANSTHAVRVIRQLGLQIRFEHIVDVYALYPHCKPEPEAFQKALAIIKEDPHCCMMIDDSINNLKTAQSLGMATVSVGVHHHDGSPHITNIKALASLLTPKHSARPA